MSTTTKIRTGNRRLLALAAFLRKLPRSRFDYTHWTGNDWKGAQDLSCGTTGCALGWAATMPRFRRLGLHLDGCGVPVMRRSGPISAAMRLFEIDCYDADHLFQPVDDETNATPKYVARKIERFVKNRAG